jgi:hypothetical protein
VTRLAALVGASVLAGACSVLAPRPDPSRYFVLTALAENERSDGTPLDGVALGLGPIGLPAYLQRAGIATRVGPNRVEFSEVARWAEPLDASFGRVVAENLSRLLGSDRIVMYPWFDATRPDYTVQIDVLRFERGSDGVAELAARWLIKDGTSRALLEDREASLREPVAGTDTEAAVAALSRAVAELSRELASAIRRLPRREPRGGR